MSSEARQYVKGISFAFLGAVAAALGFAAVGFLGDYFTAHHFTMAIAVSEYLGVDIVGAVIPLTAAVISFALLLKTKKLSATKLAVALVASIAGAFLFFHSSSEGVEGFPFLYAVIVGAMSVAVNLAPNFSGNFRGKLAASAMLAVLCTPISIFLVDLIYSSGFAGAVIGGNGLADALFVSTLYAPLAVTAAFSVLTYFSQTIWFIGQNRKARGQLSNFKPVSSEDSTVS